MQPAACRRPCRHSACSLAEPMIETKTLACCRSLVTSARVTVTPLTRGSFISNRIVSLATSRITSRTRARRWAFIQSLFHLATDVLRDRMAFQRLCDSLERASPVLAVPTDHGEPQNQRARVVEFLDLGGTHIEFSAKSVENAARHLALVFQRPGLPQQEAYL